MPSMSVATAGLPTDSMTVFARSAARSPKMSDCAYARPSDETDSFALPGYDEKNSRASAGVSKMDRMGVV